MHVSRALLVLRGQIILETIIIKLIPTDNSTYSANINHTFFYNLNFTDCTLREESNAEETFATFANSGKFAKV